MDSRRKAIAVFISYTHADESFKNELIKHLSLMRRSGDVSIWHDRDITGGKEWKGEIDTHLEQADLILLLISADFIASDYCWDVEMKRAMERHEAKTARVIPIILRETDWHHSPFSKLQALPKNARPVNDKRVWPSYDEAWVNVVQGLRRTITELAGC